MEEEEGIPGRLGRPVIHLRRPAARPVQQTVSITRQGTGVVAAAAVHDEDFVRPVRAQLFQAGTNAAGLVQSGDDDRDAHVDALSRE